jgi:hypothetical protein
MEVKIPGANELVADLSSDCSEVALDSSSPGRGLEPLKPRNAVLRLPWLNKELAQALTANVTTVDRPHQIRMEQDAPKVTE